MKSRKNPYAAKLKKSVTIRLGEDVIEYFKKMAEETSIIRHHTFTPYMVNILDYLILIRLK